MRDLEFLKGMSKLTGKSIVDIYNEFSDFIASYEKRYIDIFTNEYTMRAAERIFAEMYGFKPYEAYERPPCMKCGIYPAQEPHECPYEREINESDEECTCCIECEQDCLGDI